MPRVEVVTVSPEVAVLLDISPDSQVVSRSQDRYIDGIPWSRQTTFYLMDFITKGATDLLMAKDIEGGAVRYLADEIGVRQTGYRDWITGRLATEEEQAFFGIGHNAAVFVHSRVAFDQDNTPMRLTVTIFPVDRNQLVVNVGPNVPPLARQRRSGSIKMTHCRGACDPGESAHFANPSEVSEPGPTARAIGPHLKRQGRLVLSRSTPRARAAPRQTAAFSPLIGSARNLA